MDRRAADNRAKPPPRAPLVPPPSHLDAEARAKWLEIDQASVHLAALGFEPPGRDPARWEHVARILEICPATPPAEVFLEAQAFVDREKLRAKIAREPDAAAREGSADDRLRTFFLEDARRIDWTAAELAVALGCSRSAVAATPSWRSVMAGRAARRENLRREGLL